MLEGELVVEIDGEATTTLKTGDFAFIPAGVVHQGKDASAGSAKVLATYVLEKGKPVAAPAKCSSAAYPDLIANRVSYNIDPLAGCTPHIGAGLMRALAVTMPQRNAAFPDLTTAVEAGLPGYDFASWGGIFASAGTPRAVVQKLNSEIVTALNAPDIRKRFADMGLEAKHSSPEAFGKFLQAEISRYGALLKA